MPNKILKHKKAFSLIELSVVILIIGVIVAGVTQSSRMISAFKINTARNLTQSSPVASMRNLVMWLETTSTTSFKESQSDNTLTVDTWYDINPTSTNKYNATQATEANKPVYTSDCVNSLPCLRFTTAGQKYFSYDGSFLIGTDYTVIIVEQRRTSSDGNFFLSGSGGGLNANLILGYRYNATVTFSQFANDVDISVAAYTRPIPKIHIFRLSSTAGKGYYLNGAANTSGSAQTSYIASFATPYIGRSNIANFYYEGDICEIIMFNRAISTEERDAIETYLGKKWNIVVS